MALSHSLIKENLRRINRRRLSSLLSFFSSSLLSLLLFFCRFPFSLIRERRGALLFALNEESAAKVNRRRLLSSNCSFLLKYSFNFLLTCVGEVGVARRNFDREATKRATWLSPIRSRRSPRLTCFFCRFVTYLCR